MSKIGLVVVVVGTPVEFWAWFHQAHPAEAQAIGSPADDVNDLVDDAAVMEVFLQYVDEFIAQSETYPRSG